MDRPRRQGVPPINARIADDGLAVVAQDARQRDVDPAATGRNGKIVNRAPTVRGGSRNGSKLVDMHIRKQQEVLMQCKGASQFVPSTARHRLD